MENIFVLDIIPKLEKKQFLNNFRDRKLEICSRGVYSVFSWGKYALISQGCKVKCNLKLILPELVDARTCCTRVQER